MLACVAYNSHEAYLHDFRKENVPISALHELFDLFSESLVSINCLDDKMIL